MADIVRVSGTRSATPNQGGTTISAPSGPILLTSPTTYISGNISVAGSTSTVIIQANSNNVDNPTDRIYDSSDIYGTRDQRILGAVYVAGGLGIEKDLNVGGYIYGRISEATTSQRLLITSTNIDSTFYLTFTDKSGLSGSTTTGSVLYTDGDGVLGFAPDSPADAGLAYNPQQGKLTLDRLRVVSTDTSYSSTSGALVVAGGVGIAGDLYASNVIPNPEQPYALGTTSSQWNQGYVENLYTKIISSTSGPIQITPEGGLTEVIGDIRVLGQKPIGTAPVVTNILYVTVDGSDTNDGRAMDPSRACRTVTGAVNSPYYQSGTQIRVAPGLYLEDNPIRLKPYTSVVGSDLRTTSLETINKTQDLFHLDSGCYLAFMQFLNGRSGLLEGPYASGFNRGAYCTSFPPLKGNERIDLFHSPYVQNCTNMTGPWLRDGTMFVPNQTVQVPSAIGTGTWVANTTSIVVSVSTGSIARGMSINAGVQNLGFFNARTLMLANKSFLQEQVVAYVDATYPSPAFTYAREICRRDVGILVENVAYDTAFGGNEKSVESGLAYYRGVVSLIAGQEVQTTEAINYLNLLVQQIIVNATALVISGTSLPQIKNTVLLGGAVASSTINSLFVIITDIINNGTSSAPAIYKSPGPDAAFVSAEILMQANRAFIQQDTINWINNTYLAFPYSKVKCARDTGIIVDSIAADLLYQSESQSTFAGLQYWSQGNYVGTIANELTTTTNAIIYLKATATKIIQNITPADDLIARFYTATPQTTATNYGTDAEAAIIGSLFDTIIEIIRGNKSGWTDRVIANGSASNLDSVNNSYQLLIDNTVYLANEITNYIDATKAPNFTYDKNACQRDVGYMIRAVAFDLLHGGNRQSIQTGLYYYGFSSGTTNIGGQVAQTTDAFTHLSNIAADIVQNIQVSALQTRVRQKLSTVSASGTEAATLAAKVAVINTIINANSAPSSTSYPEINQAASTDANVIAAYSNLLDNRDFIVAEVVAFIDNAYNPISFNYNEAKCYRDVGLIVDAVSQDILLGGNQKSIEAGVSYWGAGYNYVAGQESTTTNAINHARDIALKVIANEPVTVQTGTSIVQIINPFFQYGGDYMPQQAVNRNFDIITNIINRGPQYAPPVYAGGGVFALTGVNGADVKLSPKVTSITDMGGSLHKIGLSAPTVGFGNNATLYFGDTLVYPLQDVDVPDTWKQRRVDPIGSMGGSLVDGAVISSKSPIQSFVYDAFTQIAQGGRGIHVTNDGYAQLVSVFTVFCSIGVQVDNGGIASILNSNNNFGDLCLVAKGRGKRKFTGTVYNPVFKAYPASPGDDGFDKYYPEGYWPNAGRVQIFLADTDDRPHISLVMEVIPPVSYYKYSAPDVKTEFPYLNDQGFPGFLNATPSLASLTTGSIVINDINTDGIAIGNTVYIRDQDNNMRYAATGTVVTDIGYRSITLNNALIGGGSDPTNIIDQDIINNNYFNLYFCGNSYYTVLSSEIADVPNPYNILGGVEGQNILSTAAGLPTDQVAAHIDSINKMQADVLGLIAGSAPRAGAFIIERFGNMTDIIGALNINDANAVVPKNLRTKSGTIPEDAGKAITLITENIDIIATAVAKFVTDNYSLIINSVIPDGAAAGSGYNELKCKRDVVIILQRLVYDLETGGRYNSVYTGLSYWSRKGTHHVVQLGETVRRTELFPDGCTVNFYQRSYMSASGYVFEYVGAGTNYGALPQVGRVDPVQGKETLQLDGGKVFFTSTDQNGDFRIGPGLVISQATGVLSGRTFTKSLFANMTPFILAIEGGGA